MAKIINTPLRYPGGKSKLSGFISNILDKNKILSGTYVEPFAGGAGIAIDLLLSDKVSKIILNDNDLSIYSIWYSILNHKNDLINKIIKTPITIDEWLIQKDIQKNKENQNLLDLGFSTLFLNRTNRSGIIKAGVIGGLKQNGKWKIDARFNKEKIINRIENIYKQRMNIEIYNEDAKNFIDNKIKKLPPNNTLIYFDPPYYKKGAQLYMNFFNHEDHEFLAKKIIELKHRWLVSYDNTEEIRKIYSNVHNSKLLNIRYSVGKNTSGQEILFASDNLIID